MCNRCGGKTPPVAAYIDINKVRQKQTEAYMLSNFLFGVANNVTDLLIGNILGGNVSPSVEEETQVPVTRRTEQEVEEVPEEDNTENQKEALQNLLGANLYNKLSSDLQEDILGKYDVLKSIRKLDDETIKVRLNTYIQATQEGEKRDAVKIFVTKTLDEAQVEFDEGLLDNIIEKNNLLELFDPTENNETKKKELKQKIINFVNGTNYVAAEIQLNRGVESTFTHQAIENAINNNDVEAYKKAHLQFGQEMIEVYDIANPDGKINFIEFAAYQAELNNVENVAEDITDAARVLFNMQDMNSDGYIDQNEMSADLWTTSTILDTINTPNTSHNITTEEYTATALGKEAYATILLLTVYTEGWNNLSETERQEKRNNAYELLTPEQQEAYQKYTASRKKSIDAFLPQEQ